MFSTKQSQGGTAAVEGPRSAVFHRNLRHVYPRLARAEGSYCMLENGQKVIDASGGASVGCLGWGNQRVVLAVAKQMGEAPYCPSIFWTSGVYEELALDLVESTGNRMARAYIVNSGSEAMEAAVKMARQYYLELDPPQPQRLRFISRNQSYHGTTLGALAVSGHTYRRANFEPLLASNMSKVSPCYEYRGKQHGETVRAYVDRLAKELDNEFQRLGPETVCAFVAEPIVGATTGCVPAVDGYFPAIQAVCRKYGALLILDEVMCGMGRSGTLHAWEQFGVVPDIQTFGKGLGGGYQPVAGIMANHVVVDAIGKGTSAFVNGQTYQGHPACCAAALEVQRIIREEKLLVNVRTMGALLSRLLKDRLGHHPNVGDIRGRGLFWGVEFVADKKTAEPFPPEEQVAMKLAKLGLAEEYAISFYPGTGTVDGVRGDHVIISPAYNATAELIETIASVFSRLVVDFFAAKERRTALGSHL